MSKNTSKTKNSKKVSVASSAITPKAQHKIKGQIIALSESIKDFKPKETFSTFWADFKAVRSK